MKLTEILNSTARRLDVLFPGYFGVETKHNHYSDFGWPTNPGFQQFYDMWDRNGIGAAAVNHISDKTFQDNPVIRESEDAGETTALEKAIADRFRSLRVWQQFAEADRRGMVGRYGALILRLADNRRFNEPVGAVRGGLNGLVDVIPAWEQQLRVSSWETDEMSENYGKPTMYEFNESQVGGDDNQRNPRQFQVHPDRVVIFSQDGTIHAKSILRPGYNDLLTIEKVSGSGGEGFWKNAKSAPVLNVDPKANIDKLRQLVGANSTSEIKDKVGETVDDWNKGFDKTLMLQGIEAKSLGVTLPTQPEQYYDMPLKSFAASVRIPMKILVGNQTGERASTEDVKSFNKTIASRRENETLPTIHDFIEKLVNYGVLLDRDWFVEWEDLTDTTPEEKVERADKMASTNQKMVGTGEIIYAPSEIREAGGYPAELPDEFELEEGEPTEEDLEDDEA